MLEHSIEVERRADGVIVVRVPSAERDGNRLPDAVFSFRIGDPQYAVWERRLQEQEAVAS